MVVCGRLGDSPVAVASKHVLEQPTVPSKMNRDVSPALDAVVGFARWRRTRRTATSRPRVSAPTWARSSRDAQSRPRRYSAPPAAATRVMTPRRRRHRGSCRPTEPEELALVNPRPRGRPDPGRDRALLWLFASDISARRRCLADARSSWCPTWSASASAWPRTLTGEGLTVAEERIEVDGASHGSARHGGRAGSRGRRAGTGGTAVTLTVLVAPDSVLVRRRSARRRRRPRPRWRRVASSSWASKIGPATAATCPRAMS